MLQTTARPLSSSPPAAALSPMLLLGYALAVLIGLSLGMLGGGGSVLTVPVLVYVLGLGPKEAIATSLPIVALVSLVGAAGHWRAGHVRLRTAIPFGLVTMLGAFAGARLGLLVPGRLQLVLLAAVMLAASVAMFRGRKGDETTDARAPTAGALALLAAAGLAVGVITGLVGIGGGFLIVPALVLLAGLPMRHAVGTSLVVIAMNGVSGFAGYVGEVPVRWDVLAIFSAIAVVGIAAGTRLSRRVPAAALRRAFAGLLVAVAVLMLVQGVPEHRDPPPPAAP